MTYTDEGRGSYKRTHHLSPGCAPFTGEIVYVNIDSVNLLKLNTCLNLETD